MTDRLLGSCQFDDGWPSEAAWHRGGTRWVVVIDETPVATTVSDAPGLLQARTLKWHKVEACETCANRLLAPPAPRAAHIQFQREMRDFDASLKAMIERANRRPL